MRVLNLLLPAALVCFPAALEAQAHLENVHDLFSPPGRQLRCRQEEPIPAELARGVSVAFRFVEGSGSTTERVLDVGYTDQGTPVYLTVVQNVPSVDRPFALDAARVFFGAGLKSLGFRLMPKNEGGGGQAQPGALSEIDHLSERENSRARELATRLWTIRCGKSTSSGPSLPE